MNYEIWIIYGHTKNNILLQCRCNGILYFFSWYFSLISISYEEHKIPAQLTAKCLAAVLCKACKTTALLSMTFRLCHCIWVVICCSSRASLSWPILHRAFDFVSLSHNASTPVENFIKPENACDIPLCESKHSLLLIFCAVTHIVDR